MTFKEYRKEEINEFKDKTFKDILNDIQDLIDIGTVKEKIIDGINTLKVFIKGPLTQRDLSDIEDDYPSYEFDMLSHSHILMVSLDENLQEKVSSDCSTGAGEIPDGPWKGFQVIRTNHLDDHRGSSEKARDADFDCETFDELVNGLLKKRPMGIKDDKYLVEWKNKRGYQSYVVKVDNTRKTITFITVMMLNKKSPGMYNTSGARYIFIGNIKEPN